MKKKQAGFKYLLDSMLRYWPLLVVLFGIITTIVTIPSRLKAVENKAQMVEQRTEKIESYVEAIEEQKKLIQKSPPGFQWNEAIQDYIAWPEDPRLKKKK